MKGYIAVLLVLLLLVGGMAALKPEPETVAARAPQSCRELVVNGDMEGSTAWVLANTPAPAVYTTEQAHTGSRSIRVGIVDPPNLEAYSSARQRVVVPADTMTVTLDFWLYTVSTSVDEPLGPPPSPGGEIPTYYDAQYVLVLDRYQNIRETLLWTKENDEAWAYHTFDLSHYRGETIWLHFGVYNDGDAGITGMYVDDVSLRDCDTPLDEALYVPFVTRNGLAPAGPLLVDGLWASRVIGHPQSEAIYALTDDGLYRSDDGGATWPQMASSPPVSRTILMAPGEPEVLYAGAGYPCARGGSDRPLWKSVNGGETWQKLTAGVNLEPLAVHPSDPQRVLARGCDGPHLTTDGGATWTLLDDDLYLVYEARSAAPNWNDDWQTIYVGGVTEGGGGGLIGSSDGGASWDLLTPLTAEVWAVTALAGNPLNADEVYFGDANAFWGSVDGGATWYTSTAGLEDVLYDPGAPITKTYGLLSLSFTPGEADGWLLGTVRGVYGNGDPASDPWVKVTGVPWEDEQVTALLRRWTVPYQLFVTTPDGVYVLFP